MIVNSIFQTSKTSFFVFFERIDMFNNHFGVRNLSFCLSSPQQPPHIFRQYFIRVYFILFRNRKFQRPLPAPLPYRLLNGVLLLIKSIHRLINGGTRRIHGITRRHNGILGLSIADLIFLSVNVRPAGRTLPSLGLYRSVNGLSCLLNGTLTASINDSMTIQWP